MPLAPPRMARTLGLYAALALFALPLAAQSPARVDSARHADAVRLATLLKPVPFDIGALYDDVGPADETPQQLRMRVAMKKIMVDHMAKVMPHDSLLALTVRSYEQVYTAEELRALVTFFSGALGQRYATGQHEASALTTTGARAAMRARQGELEAAIAAMMQRELRAVMSGVA
jgi:hypothetical protein